MRQMLNPAQVDSPLNLYGNVTVELVSDDDVVMTVTVRNRQGIVLEVITGPWRKEGDAWIVRTADGETVITLSEGCGCGGSSVVPRLPEGANMSTGYLP